MQPPPSQPTRFTWPPRKPTPSAPSTARTPTSSPRSTPSPATHKRTSLWSAIEHTFLDLRAGPLADRAAESHWSPDKPADYCPRCGRSAKPGSPTEPDGCGECRGITLAWSRLVRLGEYAGPLRTWIHEVKYTRWRRLGHDLGILLGERLLESHAAAGSPDQLPPLLVPVPDAALRRIIRGIDHTMVICRGVQAATGWEISQPLARRFGQSQVAVAPSERAANVAKSFVFRSGFPAERLANRRIVLIDDVCTTGSTLRTCARLIQTALRRIEGRPKSPPDIWAGVLGRTQPPEQGAISGRKQAKPAGI